LSIANRVPTAIVDKNGKHTTVHRSPEGMNDIKSRIAKIAAPQAVEVSSIDDEPDWDRASLPTQEYTINSATVGKFEHIIEKANNRLTRSGVEEQFEYSYRNDVIENPDGSHKEVIIATLNKPVISNGNWTFAATHEFTPAGEVVSYFSSEDASFKQPEDAHCDQCNTNRRRERVYTVTNSDDESKQIGSSCLELFMGVKPEGLWSLSDTKIEESLSELESLSLGSRDGVTYPLEDIIGVALQASNNGKDYVAKSRGTKENPPTAYAVEMKMQEKRNPDTFDKKAIRSVIDYISNVDSNNSDYLDNLKAIFKPGENGAFVKSRHMGLATSAVAAWYRENNQREEREAKPPVKQEWLGAKGDKIEKPMTLTLEFRKTFSGEYGESTLMVFRDQDNRLIKWGASNPPDVWEGGSIDVGRVTVKEQAIYKDDKQTAIIRPKVNGVIDSGNYPEWVAYDKVRAHVQGLPSAEVQSVLEKFEATGSVEGKRAFLASLQSTPSS
jgi:hypothetical protein